MLKTSLDTVAKLYVPVQGCWAFIVAYVTVNENFLEYIFAFFIFRNKMSMWREYLYFRGYRIKTVNLKLCS